MCAARRDCATYQHLPSRANAVRMTHFPEELTDVEIARRRLALDEFIALQREMQLRRKNFEAKSRALPCGGDNRLMKPFLARLGFKLTDAQTKVLREIRADMNGQPSPRGFGSAGAHPMRRLLQGDVGSGKTVVAACTALMALESGYNVALMSPTEILAEQHFQNFQKWFGPLGVKVELQTGSHGKGREQEANAVRRSLSDLELTPLLSPGLKFRILVWSSLTSSTDSAWRSANSSCAKDVIRICW